MTCMYVNYNDKLFLKSYLGKIITVWEKYSDSGTCIVLMHIRANAITIYFILIYHGRYVRYLLIDHDYGLLVNSKPFSFAL